MTKATFKILCDDLRPSFPDQARSWPLQLDHRVTIAVYWMASSAEYRTIANLFGVGKSTVHKCIHDVCMAIAENILDKYVKFPADDDSQHVIGGFDNTCTWGFPNCAGAVDGTHIPITAPKSAHGDYVNRTDLYSIILQAVCDHNYIITDMNVGWQGRVQDARVFGNSELYYKRETNDWFPQKTKKLVCPGKEITMPIVLPWDAAYPLKTWLLKPYTNLANLTAAKGCSTTGLAEHA